MEERFERDFSSVRIHTDDESAESAGEIHAAAYTVSNNIVFGRGHYSPDTTEGLKLIAHELVHTLQQPSGVSSFASLEIERPDSASERQANSWSNAVIGSTGQIPALSPSTVQINRQATESDDLPSRRNESDCSEATRRRMQKEVNSKCKSKSRACDGNTPESEIMDRIARSQECISARQRINNACYGGGDPGHTQSVKETVDSIQNCHDLLDGIKERATRKEGRRVNPMLTPVQSQRIIDSLGIGTAITAVVLIAALIDPEPVSKLALAGLSAVMIDRVLQLANESEGETATKPEGSI